MIRYYLLLILLGCLCNPLLANDTLDNFFKSTNNLEADFSQTIRNNIGTAIEQSTGHLLLSRPDKFILSYSAPAQQQYISDGKTIWVYDVELEQVSIKQLDESLGDSPALLLSSNNNVYNYYLVSDLDNRLDNGWHWIQLLAKQEQMNFERVLLAFSGTKLRQMIMYDNFGQITELKFGQMQVNNPLSDQQFHFSPPEGVDIIGRSREQ